MRFFPPVFVEAATAGTECVSKISDMEKNLLLATGIAGLILLFISLTFLIKNAKKNKKMKGIDPFAICMVFAVNLLLTSWLLLACEFNGPHRISNNEIQEHFLP